MTSIFLSLSFVDANFVRLVYSRLPRGVARYYEQSFERGEDLIAAMQRSLEESQIFVFFATKASLKSLAVQFELDEAHRHLIFRGLKKVFVFPIEAGIEFRDLPGWLQNAWTPNVGESPTDIARFLTTVLLEPDRGLSVAAPNVIGRGGTVDVARRLAAAHLQRHRVNPRVYIFPGINGIGRRTFAAFYLRNGLSAQANLPFGPTVLLSAQGELIDLYRALRIEANSYITPETIAEDQEAFGALSQEAQIAETVRVMGHFFQLSQAVTIVSSAGFFEDAATPKDWVKPFLQAIPEGQTLIVVSNLQFRSEFIDELRVAVQLRITELANEDIRALMIFTAELLGVEDFHISDRFLSAIGGHPDVANAAVRLSKQKGTSILEKDPRQIFNIQNSIIGDIVKPEVLGPTERLILDVLGWLPNLGSDLLERIIVVELGQSADKFNTAIEGLILGCLIYATGYRFAIAGSIRQLYRRYNITDEKTTSAMAKVFSSEWNNNKDQTFRDDLFSAFVFMHLLEGRSLPPELRRLLTASNLYDAVRDVYARGKATDNLEAIKQAIEWGKIATEMNMAESLREEILSTVARAQIRLDRHADAEETIELMRKRGYRQVVFLEGHALRKQRKFEEAIPKFRYVLDHNRGNRAAVHELAICYRRMRKTRELEALLKEFSGLLDDSAEFLDFSVALQISRGDLRGVPAAIKRLRDIDESSNRADLRYAQYLSKTGDDRAAFTYLSEAAKSGTRGSVRLLAARAIYAARGGLLKEARDTLATFRALENNDARAMSIEAQILMGEGKPRAAYEINRKTEPQEPGDWLFRALILDAVANDPGTGLKEALDLRHEAQIIRAKFVGDVDFIFGD